MLFRGLIIWILMPRWKVNIMEGFMNLLVKSDPGSLNRQGESKIERESQKRSRSRLIQESEMASAFALVTKVSENQSLIKFRSDQI